MVELEITDVRAFTVLGDFPFEDEQYMEERLVRPADIYPELFETGPDPTKKTSKKTMELTRSFLEVTTKDGITGLAPLALENWWVINNPLRPLLIGKDALAIEKIWDQMYRTQVHCRKCQTMIAISTIDCCLWDIIGKARKEPVHRLLGGPVKDKIRIYASMLGHSLKPKLVAKRALEMADLGYTAQKWFFRYGPSAGIEGERKNLDLAKNFRDAVGYDSELMLDCWMSWSIPYAIRMAKKLEKYEPSWLEEVLLPDQIDGYAEIRAKVDIPLSGAEHEYTRWGFMQYFRKSALDIWQPDITWAGRISEVNKICVLGSTAGIPIVPHSGNVRMSSPIWFSHNIETSPIGEYLVKHNALAQYFYKKPLTPDKGYIKAPSDPGLGTDLDEDKILKKEYLK